jgi:hypothetical protein
VNYEPEDWMSETLQAIHLRRSLFVQAMHSQTLSSSVDLQAQYLVHGIQERMAYNNLIRPRNDEK